MARRNGREYELTVRQEPKQARMCGVGGKADRRPIDPPPIVQLRVIDPSHRRPLTADSRASSPDGTPTSSASQSFLQNPYYFMFASLAKPDEDVELHWLKDGKTRCTTGSVVSSLYHLKDAEAGGSDAGFFVFPDLSVRTEGSYRLKLSLYEVVGTIEALAAFHGNTGRRSWPASLRGNYGPLVWRSAHVRWFPVDGRRGPGSLARAITPRAFGHAMRPSGVHGDGIGAMGPRRIDSSVYHCKSIFSAPFYVYTAKKFPGMEESTPLSCSLADQGIKIRIRKDIRVRKRPMQGLSETPIPIPLAGQPPPSGAFGPVPVRLDDPDPEDDRERDRDDRRGPDSDAGRDKDSDQEYDRGRGADSDRESPREEPRRLAVRRETAGEHMTGGSAAPGRRHSASDRGLKRARGDDGGILVNTTAAAPERLSNGPAASPVSAGPSSASVSGATGWGAIDPALNPPPPPSTVQAPPPATSAADHHYAPAPTSGPPSSYEHRYAAAPPHSVAPAPAPVPVPASAPAGVPPYHYEPHGHHAPPPGHHYPAAPPPHHYSHSAPPPLHQHPPPSAYAYPPTPAPAQSGWYESYPHHYPHHPPPHHAPPHPPPRYGEYPAYAPPAPQGYYYEHPPQHHQPQHQQHHAPPPPPPGHHVHHSYHPGYPPQPGPPSPPSAPAPMQYDYAPPSTAGSTGDNRSQGASAHVSSSGSRAYPGTPYASAPPAPAPGPATHSASQQHYAPPPPQQGYTSQYAHAPSQPQSQAPAPSQGRGHYQLSTPPHPTQGYSSYPPAPGTSGGSASMSSPVSAGGAGPPSAGPSSAGGAGSAEPAWGYSQGANANTWGVGGSGVMMQNDPYAPYTGGGNAGSSGRDMQRVQLAPLRVGQTTTPPGSGERSGHGKKNPLSIGNIISDDTGECWYVLRQTRKRFHFR
ncbi:hypothetical protein IEO21_08022 [Rhodonia placenta]|uniref:Velvet domain-containing protein n=1 Tax=Rhodonia placenta TaxID=104341 RepID=A0A8H7TZL5_9APHY|nr:hypothetical protein IEO21_08022 [Postia placenta]